MAINSRQKGKTGELEIVRVLKELFGWSGRRTQQFSGWAKGGASADIYVDQTPDLFWEIKRVERLNINNAMALAVEQADRKCPVVLHRVNRSPDWLLTIRLQDLPRLAHAYESAVNCGNGHSQTDDTVAP
jgi:hypothetical protein